MNHLIGANCASVAKAFEKRSTSLLLEDIVDEIARTGNQRGEVPSSAIGAKVLENSAPSMKWPICVTPP
jgi:hypothetical protein